MTKSDFEKVGFKTLAQKFVDGIKDKIAAAPLLVLMSASNIFGRGFSDKKIELIMESYPNILISNENKLQKINNIVSIKGMSLKTAEPFVERIPEFIQFMKNAGLESKLLVISENFVDYDESHPLFEKTIVMTGFRDAQLQDAIKKVGAKLGSTVSKNTCIVLVKDLMEDTSKAEDARNLGIPLMTPEQFKKKYLL
jgi:NAD-dependent DNA ligase